MSLQPGDHLGPYEVVSQLGQGGMGVVYHARDSRLERDVAVKVLPRNLAEDDDALGRFEREAKAVAALSHPNILAIHDFGQQEGTVYAAMELLKGETLRQRLLDGALPASKALEYALQIVQGLAAAHDEGITHRDLKPENIFLPESGTGTLKILDFGLARREPTAADGGDMATVSLSTEPGRVMGTVGYMAPEQVRGRDVDARTDIFAFGAVLYEMLTGKRAFHGESPVETLNAILKEDPPSLFDSTRNVSPGLERIVRRCLEKRPEERPRTAHDLAIALEAISTGSTRTWDTSDVAAEATARARRRRWLERSGLVAAGAAVALAAVALVARLNPPEEPVTPVYRWMSFSGRDSSPAVSSDGRTVAFASDRDGRLRIWLKQVSGEAEAPLTTGPDDFPRFSPDGAEILFARAGPEGPSLFRAAVLGGAARRLIEDATEGDWSPDGTQVAFLRMRSENGKTVSSVGVMAADGSDPREVAAVPAGLRAPRWSPDGRTLAFVTSSGSLLAGAQQPVVLVDVETGETRAIPAPDARRTLSAPAWTADGQVVYLQAESVAAAAGSAGRLVFQDAASGDVQARLWSPSTAQVLDVLGDGRVVFDTRSPRQNLREVAIDSREEDSDGRWLSRGESTDRQPVYSPDGDTVAFSSNRGGGMNLWVVSTSTGRLRRLTSSHLNWDPGFTREGRIVWSSNRSGNYEIWIADSDGSAAAQVTEDGGNAENPTATPDGEWIVYSSGNPEKAGLWKIHPDGTGATHLFEGRATIPEVSPDGRHAVFRSFTGKYPARLRVARIEDGELEPFEILVEAHRRTTISLGRARWMPDGSAIVFVGQDETGATGLYAQDFVPGRDTSATRRKVAGFDPDVAAESFAMSRDGSRLVIAGWVQLFSLMEAEGLPALLAPPRGP